MENGDGDGNGEGDGKLRDLAKGDGGEADNARIRARNVKNRYMKEIRRCLAG